jgi:hypothetical protein
MAETTTNPESTPLWPWLVAAGVTLVVGVVGFFGFKAIAKKTEITPTPETTPTPTPTPTPGPIPPTPDKKPAGQAKGKPPNISGDPEGYNSEIWAGPFPVRSAFAVIGYPVSMSPEDMNVGLGGPDPKNPQPNPHVTQFQKDWNKVANAVAGGLKIESKTAIPLISKYTGKLDVDGIAGPNTLNGLEIAWRNQFDSNVGWPALVKEA